LPHLIISARARAGLERCRTFLASRNRTAAEKAGETIRTAFRNLATHPEIGRLVGTTDELRELVISFGATGYMALYSFDRTVDAVVILAFRHQREVGY
jgi:plasmid stabilization system protein ParE